MILTLSKNHPNPSPNIVSFLQAHSVHVQGEDIGFLHQGLVTTLVCLQKDLPVGFLSYQAVGEEAEILYVFVLEAFRKQGFAQELLNVSLQQMQEHVVETVFLEVRMSNTGAIAFYEKNQFNGISLRKAYYSDNNEDAKVMKKDFCHKIDSKP